MDVLYARCAGLDVHKKTVVACARLTGPDGRQERLVRSFGTTTAELLELADWLAESGVTHAAMESTGVYWKPVWHLLEGRLELMLVNARHIKQVPGRKTDVKDAEWIAQLLQHGLLRPSFVPPPPIRELRDLTRQRTQLVRDRATAIDRIGKVLEGANIKLAGVATDIQGASGRAMIEAMIAGRDDPAALAELARGRLREKRPQLREALRGRVTEPHRFLLRAAMDQVRQLEDLIARFTARIEEVMAPFDEAAGRLETIPGVSRRAAEVIVAAIGTDMSRFPTAGHLCSWAGLCPGNDVSAGKRRSGRTTKGSAWLRATLVQAAWAASHTKATALSVAYRRWARRLGKKPAVVALGRKILALAYELLERGTGYVERLGPIPFKWAQVTASCYLGFAENRGNQEAATRMPRGQCTLPADDAGRILDRLAGLEQVIRPDDIRQALTATGRVNTCDCVLTYEVILWVVLAMGLLTDLPIRQVFKHARRLRAGEPSPGRSNLCMARRRLGVAPVRHLFGRVVRPLARPETPGAFYRGLRLMGIGGVVLDVPDSAANAAAFGRPSAGPRGDGAFPQVKKLSLVELGTHAEVAFIVRPCRSDERAMVAGLLGHLMPGMLLLLDRAFFSYERWRRLEATGAKLLVRVAKSMILRPIRPLADGSYLAKVYRNDSDRRKDRDGVVVRVIRYALDDPQRVGHGEEHVLITNLLDEAAHPAGGLIILCHERWEEELTFDEQKTHQDPRRATKPAQLRSETPAGVIQEPYALSLGHFVIRSLMFEAAGAAGLDPDALSFTGCFQTLKCRLPECESRSDAAFEAWYRAMLWEMQAERIDPRRNRINPRVIKRKMSKWKKKRSEHRHLPPLKNTFPEAVVMLR